MRHRRKGRTLGRAPHHRKALLRNMASALILTERDADEFEFDSNLPKVRGRIVTTLEKAKEVRPLVEKCVTIARRSLEAQEHAKQFASDHEKESSEWKEWRQGDEWKHWVEAQAPVVAARRRVAKLLQDKVAVDVLFKEIAPRYTDRPGGYTRVVRLAKPRLGDAGTRAVLEFVGVHDRVVSKSEKPSFADPEEPVVEEELTSEAEQEAADSVAADSVEEQKAGEQEVASDETSVEQAKDSAGDGDGDTKDEPAS